MKINYSGALNASWPWSICPFSVPASSDTVEFEGRQKKQWWITKESPLKNYFSFKKPHCTVHSLYWFPNWLPVLSTYVYQTWHWFSLIVISICGDFLTMKHVRYMKVRTVKRIHLFNCINLSANMTGVTKHTDMRIFLTLLFSTVCKVARKS